MSDLKPCPFCGGEPELMGGGETSEEGACWWVRCHACGCSQGVYLLDDSGVEAIEAWNRRAQPAPITSESGNQAAQGASAITSESVPLLTDALERELSQVLTDAVYMGWISDKSRQAIEQAVRSKLGAGVGWQPIETAPRDGSMFLCWVYAERYGETDEGQQYAQDVSQADFGWWLSGDNAGYFDCGCGQIGDRQHISHWMPLPPPPGIVGKEGGK